MEERRRAYRLRGPAVIVAQDAAQALTADDRGAVVGRLRGRPRRRDQLVGQPLMVALDMVVRDELGDGEAEMSFPEQNKLVEALGLGISLQPREEALGTRR